MLGAQQLQSGWGRAGRRRSGPIVNVEPLTAAHLAYAWGLWIKPIYSVISLCPVSSADKSIVQANGQDNTFSAQEV